MNIKSKIFFWSLNALLTSLWSSAFANEFRIKNVEFVGINAANATIPTSYKKQLEEKDFSVSLAQDLIANLYATNEVDQIKLYQKGEDTLLIECVPKPRIVAIDIVGKTPLGEGRFDLEEDFKNFLQERGMQAGVKYSQSALESLCALFRLRKENEGIHDLSINIQAILISKKSAVRLRVTVISGSTAKLKDVSILGHRSLSKKELLNSLAMKNSTLENDPLFPDVLAPSFSSGLVYAEKDALEACYKQHGYLKPAISFPVVSLAPTKDGIYVTYVIENEGRRYFWKNVDIVGADEKTAQIVKSFSSSLRKFKGQPVNYDDVTVLKQQIESEFRERGYHFSEISEQKEEDIEKGEVTLKLYCRCGDLTYIRNVIINDEAGLALPYYFKVLSKTSGSLADVPSISADINTLYNLPALSNVQYRIARVDGQSNLIDLIYSASKNSASEAASGGVKANAKEFTIEAQFQKNNIFGTGRVFGFEGQIELYKQNEHNLHDQRLKKDVRKHYWENLKKSPISGSVNFSDNISMAPFLGYTVQIQKKGVPVDDVFNSGQWSWKTCVLSGGINFLKTIQEFNLSCNLSIEPVRDRLAGLQTSFSYLPSWNVAASSLNDKQGSGVERTLEKALTETSQVMGQCQNHGYWSAFHLPVTEFFNISTQMSAYRGVLNSKEYPTGGSKLQCYLTGMSRNSKKFMQETLSGSDFEKKLYGDSSILPETLWLSAKYISFDLFKNILHRKGQKTLQFRTDAGCLLPLYSQGQREHGALQMSHSALQGTLADFGFNDSSYGQSGLSSGLGWRIPGSFVTDAQSNKGKFSNFSKDHNYGGLGFFGVGLNFFTYWLPEFAQRYCRMYLMLSTVALRANKTQRLLKTIKQNKQAQTMTEFDANFKTNCPIKIVSILGLRFSCYLPIGIVFPFHFILGWHLSPTINSYINSSETSGIFCSLDDLGVATSWVSNFEMISSQNGFIL